MDSVINSMMESISLDTMAISDTESARYNPSATRVNDILHTRLEVSFNIPAQQLFGKATIDVKPYFFPVDSLILDAKSFDIYRIAMADEKAALTDLTYKYDGVQLRIYLGKTYTRNDNYRVFIQYTANPSKVKAKGSAAITDARGLYFIDPKEEDPLKPTQIWTQGETEANSCWFPTIDKPNEKMTHELAITVPEKYKTLSNGLLTGTKNNVDATRTDTWKMDLPNAPYLVMMAIGEYAVVKDKWRQIAVDYYVEKEFEPYARQIFGNTPEMIEFFSKRTGVDYPWQKYSQVVVRDYVSGAMENTSATLFGEFVQQTPRQMVDGNYEDIISHELFHHWFGDYVTCESWANLALNESFATYGEYLWQEHKYGRDAADHHIQNDRSTYQEEAFQKKVNLVRFDYENKEDMFDRHTYQKGGLILHMLRKYVGDDAFFEGLRIYLTENKFQPAEVHQLRLAFEKVTGEDLNWFFNQWMYDKGHPSLSASWTWNETDRSVLLDLSQTQDVEANRLFRLPMDIDIYENNKTRRIRINMEKLSQQFIIPCTVKPDFVNVDAERMLLGQLNQLQTTEQAQYQFTHAPLYMDRFYAVEKMLDNSAEPGVSEMLKMALRDKFWNIRLYTLKGLENTVAQSPEDFKPVLMQMAEKDEKPSVRSEAITLLSSFGKDPLVFALFEKLLVDSSEEVQSSALSAMYDADPEKTKAIIGKIESTAKGDLLISIAAIYAGSGEPGKWDYMRKAYEGMSDPNGKYIMIQVMGKYVLSQDEKLINNAVPVFTDISRKSGAWYHRLSGIQVLAEIKNYYDSKSDGLTEEISGLIEKGTAVSLVQEKELEKTVYKKRSTDIDVILDSIREEEKDPNLSKILNMMGN